MFHGQLVLAKEAIQAGPKLLVRDREEDNLILFAQGYPPRLKGPEVVIHQIIAEGLITRRLNEDLFQRFIF